MEVRLDGPEGSLGLLGDLGQRQVPEEPERDDLAVRLLERCDRGPDVHLSLLPERRSSRILGGRTGAMASRRQAVGIGIRAGRIDPGYRPSRGRHPNGDADGGPDDPGPDGPLCAPGPERAVGGHERILGSVLGLVEAAEDPVAGPDHRSGFAVDDRPERIAVTVEDASDDGCIVPGSSAVGRLCREDRRSSMGLAGSLARAGLLSMMGIRRSVVVAAVARIIRAILPGVIRAIVARVVRAVVSGVVAAVVGRLGRVVVWRVVV